MACSSSFAFVAVRANFLLGKKTAKLAQKFYGRDWRGAAGVLWQGLGNTRKLLVLESTDVSFALNMTLHTAKE